MKRRTFIAVLGGAAAAWPLAARAQKAGKVPTIGFLGADAAGWRPWTDAFVGQLHKLGWIEGRTIAIEYRWSQARPERATEIAAEFVRLKVDVIVTSGTSVPTVKQATAVIPIVFAIAIDPVGGGLIASLARPGGNVTGLSVQQTDIAGKRLELLREVVPALRRLAIMVDVGFAQGVLEMGEVKATARTLGLETVALEIRRAEDIAPAFEALKAQADALYVVVNALVTTNRTRIITLALGARLPTIFNTRDFVQAGALMSYGPNGGSCPYGYIASSSFCTPSQGAAGRPRPATSRSVAGRARGSRRWMRFVARLERAIERGEERRQGEHLNGCRCADRTSPN